jgi:hypothetical protein
MSGATPPFPNTSSWRGAHQSTGTTLPLPLRYLFFYVLGFDFHGEIEQEVEKIRNKI